MILHRQTSIPMLVRVKPGALDRMGTYVERAQFRSVAIFVSEGFVPEWIEAVRRAPELKPKYYTVLSDAKARRDAEHLLEADEWLGGCFR